MKILALDSSGLVASVAVVSDDNLIGEYTINYKKTHSQTLLPMLDEVAKMTELDLKTIDFIAVSAGPGSFTGLRIGSATAKGLALALDKQIVSVPTVDALAYNLWGSADVVCPLMDARRQQTYTGLYDFTDGRMNTILPQCVVMIEEIVDQINELGRRVIFLGDGVDVFRDYINEHVKVDYDFAPAMCNKQRASAVACLGQVLYEQGRAENAADHKPEYLRLSQAERERQEKERDFMIIRPMEPEDADSVAQIEKDSFTQPWSRQGFLDAMRLPENIMLVAQEDGEILGYQCTYVSFDEGELTNIAVKKSARGKGVGAHLIRCLQEKAKESGVERIVLEARVTNEAAISLYQKMGFVNLGIRKNLYEHPVEDGVIMSYTAEENLC